MLKDKTEKNINFKKSKKKNPIQTKLTRLPRELEHKIKITL
jgi:hypothetical protein